MPAALNPQTLINAVMRHTEGIETADLAGGDDSKTRERILIELQAVNDEIHHLRNWQWKYKTANVTILINTDSIVVPTDFEDIGEEGSVYTAADNRELNPVQIQVLTQIREAAQQGSGVAYEYAIFANKFQTIKQAQDLILRVTYCQTPQVISDGTTAFLIPGHYGYTALRDGVVARCQTKKSDPRSVWQQRYNASLTQMIIRERQRANELQVMPGFLGPSSY